MSLTHGRGVGLEALLASGLRRGVFLSFFSDVEPAVPS